MVAGSLFMFKGKVLPSWRAKRGHPEKKPLDHHVAIAPRDDGSFVGFLKNG